MACERQLISPMAPPPDIPGVESAFAATPDSRTILAADDPPCVKSVQSMLFAPDGNLLVLLMVRVPPASIRYELFKVCSATGCIMARFPMEDAYQAALASPHDSDQYTAMHQDSAYPLVVVSMIYDQRRQRVVCLASTRQSMAMDCMVVFLSFTDATDEAPPRFERLTWAIDIKSPASHVTMPSLRSFTSLLSWIDTSSHSDMLLISFNGTHAIEIALEDMTLLHVFDLLKIPWSMDTTGMFTCLRYDIHGGFVAVLNRLGDTTLTEVYSIDRDTKMTPTLLLSDDNPALSTSSNIPFFLHDTNGTSPIFGASLARPLPLLHIFSLHERRIYYRQPERHLPSAALTRLCLDRLSGRAALYFTGFTEELKYYHHVLIYQPDVMVERTRFDWRLETRHLAPSRVRDAIHTVTMLRSMPELPLSALPNELLFLIFSFL